MMGSIGAGLNRKRKLIHYTSVSETIAQINPFWAVAYLTRLFVCFQLNL